MHDPFNKFIFLTGLAVWFVVGTITALLLLSLLWQTGRSTVEFAFWFSRCSPKPSWAISLKVYRQLWLGNWRVEFEDKL